ncbi:peroxisomal membrane protein-domain-containing protein, partial [Jimgerdemannia flammicorona]
MTKARRSCQEEKHVRLLQRPVAVQRIDQGSAGTLSEILSDHFEMTTDHAFIVLEGITMEMEDPLHDEPLNAPPRTHAKFDILKRRLAGRLVETDGLGDLTGKCVGPYGNEPSLSMSLPLSVPALFPSMVESPVGSGIVSESVRRIMKRTPAFAVTSFIISPSYCASDSSSTTITAAGFVIWLASAVKQRRSCWVPMGELTKNGDNDGGGRSQLVGIVIIDEPGMRWLQFPVFLPTVFAALNLLGLYHDSILTRAAAALVTSSPAAAAQLPPPSTFNRYTRFWYSSSNAYKRIAMLLTFVSYTEVLIEMGVQKKWGTKAKWRLVTAIE